MPQVATPTLLCQSLFGISDLSVLPWDCLRSNRHCAGSFAVCASSSSYSPFTKNTGRERGFQNSFSEKNVQQLLFLQNPREPRRTLGETPAEASKNPSQRKMSSESLAEGSALSDRDPPELLRSGSAITRNILGELITLELPRKCLHPIPRKTTTETCSDRMTRKLPEECISTRLPKFR